MNDRVTAVICSDWPVVAVTPRGMAMDGERQREGATTAVLKGNRVVACSATARARGVRVGLRRREAQSRCPSLQIFERDLAAEVRAFEPVLTALDDVVARVEVETPGWCSFPTRGPSRYFGGDDAMSLRVVDVVQEALTDVIVRECTEVRVGTADTRFAAHLAAAVAPPGHARVIPPGGTAAFLAPIGIESLMAGRPDGAGAALTSRRSDPVADLVQILRRLGLSTLGDFAELSEADVVARFGRTGQSAHRQAAGEEQRFAILQDPPEDLGVSIELDPPVERVDQATFVAKSLAEDFCQRLAGRGLTCAHVAIGARTEHGQEWVRLWRGEGSLTVAALAERTRWQLDGWLSTRRPRSAPTAGVVALWLHPEQVMAATGRQLGFWGGESHHAERAARAAERIQGLLGVGSVTVPGPGSGRSIGEEVVRVPAETVDLVERAITASALAPGETCSQRTASAGSSAASAGSSAASAGSSAASAGSSAASAGKPWTGRLPTPRPVVVFDPPRLVELFPSTVTVSGRGLISTTPEAVEFDGDHEEIVGWAGPWLTDERWWDADSRHRAARLQVVTTTGRALLLISERGTWMCEALYD